MAVKLTWNKAAEGALVQACYTAAYDQLLLGGLFLQRALKRAVGISNRKGEEPSSPGSPPRRSQHGFLQSQIVIEGNGKDAVRVGITKKARYGIWLEFGTGPYTIRAKGGKKLAIPIRAGTKSPAELKAMGAKKMIDRKDGRKKWFVFRKVVHHPGIAARPWLRPTFLAAKDTIANIIAGITGSGSKSA